MTALVPDEMLNALSIIGEYDEIPGMFKERYGGLVDEMHFSIHDNTPSDAEQLGTVASPHRPGVAGTVGQLLVTQERWMDDAPPVPSLDPARFKLGSESDLAYSLKWEAWEWLYSSARCRCIGFEVRLQGPWGTVVDVVGVGPGNAIYLQWK